MSLILTGTDGNDTLLGGDGDDILSDRQGNDRLRGGVGNDRLTAWDGGDTLEGGDGDDDLLAFSSLMASTLSGGAGDDTLEVFGTESLAFGGAGNDWVHASEDRHTIYGGEGHDTLHGGWYAQLYGGPGDDVVFGGEGDDTLYGGDGDDVLGGKRIFYSSGLPEYDFYYDLGNDLVFGGPGNDVIGVSFDGSDTVHGGSGDDLFIVAAFHSSSEPLAEGHINGGAGFDTVQAEDLGNITLANVERLEAPGSYVGASIAQVESFSEFDGYFIVLRGPGGTLDLPKAGGTWASYNVTAEALAGGLTAVAGPGDDVDIIGSEFADHLTLRGYGKLQGRAGNDTLIGGSERNWIEGGSGNDVLRGRAGNDDLEGGTGNDDIRGGGGDDVLRSGWGRDTLRGGAGDDHYFVTGTNDRIIEWAGKGIDTVTVNRATDWTLAPNLEHLTLTSSQDVSARGNDAGNEIRTSHGNDIVDGGKGNDTLLAGGGNDLIYGDSGDDTIKGGLHDDYLYGEEGDDILIGGSGDDDLWGGDGADDLRGAEGRDYLAGGTGNDTLNGGDGNDRLDGGDGDDVLSGGSGNDRLYSSLGSDNIDGGSGNDQFYLYSGADTFTGGNGADTFYLPSSRDDLPALGTTLIMDFQPGEDRFAAYKRALEPDRDLHRAIFLDERYFHIGTQADAWYHRIIYDNATGHLYLDPDGWKEGGAIHIATLTGAPALTAADFDVTW